MSAGLGGCTRAAARLDYFTEGNILPWSTASRHRCLFSVSITVDWTMMQSAICFSVLGHLSFVALPRMDWCFTPSETTDRATYTYYARILAKGRQRPIVAAMEVVPLARSSRRGRCLKCTKRSRNNNRMSHLLWTYRRTSATASCTTTFWSVDIWWATLPTGTQDWWPHMTRAVARLSGVGRRRTIVKAWRSDASPGRRRALCRCVQIAGRRAGQHALGCSATTVSTAIFFLAPLSSFGLTFNIYILSSFTNSFFGK